MRSTEGRDRIWTVWLVLALAPLLMLGSWIALQQNANKVNDWLPKEYDATINYEWFREHFGNDEFVLVSWEGCTLEDTRLDRLAKVLKSSETGESSRPGNKFRRVVTGQSILQELMAPPIELSRDAAIDRLAGTFVGPDRRQTCMLLELTPPARNNLHVTLAEIQDAIGSVGVPPASVKLGGSPVVNAAMDAISIKSMFRAIFFTCAVAVVIAWGCIRDVRQTVLVLLTGLLSMAASLAVLPICGVHLNATLFTMVPMVQTAAVSGAIHLCNYYRQAVRDAGVAGAASRAVRHALVPLSLAAGTTAAGLLSICYSDLQPIQQFGLFSAIGIGLSWLLLIFWLPAALSLWSTDDTTELTPESPATATATGEAPLSRFWQYIADNVLGYHRWMAIGCFLLLLACAPGLFWFSVSIDMLHELPTDSEAISDFNWLEERVCFLTTMEIIIRVPDSSPLSLWERIRLVQRVQDRIALLENVGGVMSVASFIPEFKGRDLTLIRRPAINRQLEKQRPRLLDSRFLARGNEEELWRVAVRVASMRKLDLGRFSDLLKDQTQQELQSERFAGISTIQTGLSSAIFRARRSLVDGLILGLFTDVLLIYVTVLVLMRSWSGGLMMIIGSVFPTCIVLGIIGWFGIEVYVGTVMAPCVALGVTVDDVIHFMIWFRNGTQQGLSHSDSLQLAWRRCARPMYQSWILLGGGMLTLLLCDFTSIRQFGTTMAAMLTAGLVGNLVLIPALLAGRLGWLVAGMPQSMPLVHAASTTASTEHDSAS